MALSTDDPEADRLARALASSTGESLTTAVTVALRERLERCSGWSIGLPGGTVPGDGADRLGVIRCRGS
jgi:antitoxin VapB